MSYYFKVCKTFNEVANMAKLDTETRRKFVAYMSIRWPEEELIQCQTGYACEWAMRFKCGIEYESSDITGKKLLEELGYAK